MKIVLFGASKIAREYCQSLAGDTIVLGIADNRYSEINGFAGHSVIKPDEIKRLDMDYVIIAIDDLKQGNDIEIFNIYNQLLEMGIPDEKIVLQSFKYMKEHPQHKPRTDFTNYLSMVFEMEGIDGSIAECGVYRGWFSGIISEIFKNQPLYLFDTFDGFRLEDVELEDEAAFEWVKNGANARLKNTSENIVKLRCYNRSRLIIKKGYVPETLMGIEDKFCFVNLDMDLYNPQHCALEFFGERMVSGGVILLHDYFSKALSGTKRAVTEFSRKDDYSIVPIGDQLSIALIRK